MASVTAVTTEKAAEVRAASVTFGFLSPDGNLMLQQDGGAQLNAGPLTVDRRDVVEGIVTLSGYDTLVPLDVIVPDWYAPPLGNVKMGNPAVLPSSSAAHVACSRDGQMLAVAHALTPFITVYIRSYPTGTDSNTGHTWTKITSPATLPTGAAKWVAWSNDSQYLAVAHTTSPSVTIYKRSGTGPTGTVLTKLANPATLPVGNGIAVGWSPDDTHLVVSHPTTPFITIYKKAGDTFTKLTNPSTLPVGSQITSPAFDPSGQYLALGQNASPYLLIYKRTDDTFTKLTDPVGMPTTTVAVTAWSPNGAYLACGHSGGSFITIFERVGSTFTKLTAVESPGTGGINGLAWSPDSRYLAASRTTAATGTPLVIYKRNQNNFTKIPDLAEAPASTALTTGMTFTPDGQQLIVASTAASPFMFIYKSSMKPSTAIQVPVSIRP